MGKAMGLKRILAKVLVGAILGSIIVVSAVAYLLPNDKQLREHVQSYFRDTLGRDVKIGSIKLAWWRMHPRVVLSDVIIANPQWADQADFARAGEFSLDIKVLKLLDGELYIHAIAARNIHVFLQRNARNQRNWIFAKVANNDPDRRGTSQAPATKLASLSVDNARISYTTPGATRSVQFESLALSASAGDAQRLQANGSVGNRSWQVNGEVQRLMGWLSGNANAHIALDIGMGAASLALTGDLRTETLALAANFKDTLHHGRHALPVFISATLRGGWPRMAAQDLAFSIGKSRGTADFALTFGAPRALLEGAVTLTDIDNSVFSRDQRTVEQTSASGSISDESAASPAQTRALPQFKALPIDVSLSLAAAKLPLTPPVHDFRGLLSITDTRVALERFSIQVAGGKVTGTLEVTPHERTQGVAINLHMRARDLALKHIVRSSRSLLESAVDGEIDISARGNSIASLASSATGSTRMLLGQGRVKLRAAETLTGGLHALSDLLTSRNHDWVSMNCAVAAFKLEDGQAVAQALIMDTQRTTITGEGSANLKREELAFLFKPHPKATTLNLTVPVRLVGTFATPELQLDEAATARRVGGVVAGLVFPPALFAAFADLGYAQTGCLPAQAAASETGSSVLTTLEKTASAASAGVVVATDEASKAAQAAGDLLNDAGKKTGTIVQGAAQGVGKAATSVGKAVEKAVGATLDGVSKGLKSLFGN